MVNAGADLLCGRGKDSRVQAAALTSTQALAWFWQQLVGEQQVRWAVGARCSVLVWPFACC